MTTLGKAWYLESVLIGSNSYPGKRQKMRKKMDEMGKESEAAEQSVSWKLKFLLGRTR